MRDTQLQHDILHAVIRQHDFWKGRVGLTVAMVARAIRRKDGVTRKYVNAMVEQGWIAVEEHRELAPTSQGRAEYQQLKMALDSPDRGT